MISETALSVDGILRGVEGISEELGIIESGEEGRSFAAEQKVIVDQVRMASDFVVSVSYGPLGPHSPPKLTYQPEVRLVFLLSPPRSPSRTR